MTTTISDGQTGSTAGVNSRNMLETFSVTQQDSTDASLGGNTFFVTHDIVTLTTDNQSFVFYVKNDDTVDWVVNEFQSFYGKSENGSGDLSSTFIINPTGGSLIANEVAGFAGNMNLGSPKVLLGSIFKGVEGDTITGGVSVPDNLVPAESSSDNFTAGPIVIAAGTSFAFGATPPVGNTSMNVKFTIIIHRDEM